MKTTIQKKKDIKDHNLVIENSIDYLRENSFNEIWKKSISDILDEEDININSLIIGKVGELPDRIYVGANTNMVLIYDLFGKYIDSIELNESEKVKKLRIVDVTNHFGNELIIQTYDDSVLFYKVNHKGDFEEEKFSIRDRTSSITALFAIKNNEEYSPIFIGDSKGNVLKNNYLNLGISEKAKSILHESDTLVGETISAISGSNKLVRDNFGLVVGYKNGQILLLNSKYDVISKYDIDREIENIYIAEKNQSIIITTDDCNIYHFSISDDILVNNWSYYFNSTISTIITNSQIDTNIEFFVISENNGTISCFEKNGNFILTGDKSFEGTTGVFFEQKLFLASRVGEISQFEIIAQPKYKEIQKLIYDSYNSICLSKSDSSFNEFFNAEFESNENVDYFKLFLINYLTNKPEEQVIDKIIKLFQQRWFNTNMAEGLIRKIISGSNLKNIFLERFKETVVSNQIIDFIDEIEKKRNETNLFGRAEGILKKDILKYIDMMCELRIHKLDKIWMNNILEDDHIVGIKLFHDPYANDSFQILIATQKGSVLLLNRQTGQIIWSFKLDREAGTITNMDVADICNDGILEIVLGLKNAHNSIIILSTNSEKFNSGDNEVKLKWTNEKEQRNLFKLYLTKCNVSGINYDAIHNVQCFDFDNNGVKDLIISSANGTFNIFIFENNNRTKITPRTESIKLHDDEDDVLVFELISEANQQITLYTGSSAGNIEKHTYKGGKFLFTENSFTERDAKVTDIVYAEIKNEKLLFFSSEDNFIYCLNDNLEYKWAFKTRAEVKSIRVSRFNNEDLIFTISKDGYLYALDAFGNKKWSYFFMSKNGSSSPLDQFYVENDEIIVADSDGNVHLLQLKDTIEIIEKMDKDLADCDLDLNSLIDNQTTNVRVFAIRKLLATNPDKETLDKIILLLSDENEPEEIVRCETIKILTRYLLRKDIVSKELSKALVETLKDFSPDVRIEGVQSLFTLIEKHISNNIDISTCFVKLADDEDNYVKEYFAGALNKFETNNEETLLAKWNALSSLIKFNIEEEWILNEAASSIGNFLSIISNPDLLTKYIIELFEYDFEDETFERILNKIPSSKIAALFDVYFQIVFGDSSKIREAFESLLKECSDEDRKTFKLFIDKIQSFLDIVDQILLNDIINDDLLYKFGKAINNSSFSLDSLINILKDYSREDNTSERIITLNFASSAIATISTDKTVLNIIDRQLFVLAVEVHVSNLISGRSTFHMENVELDIEMENREIVLNENGIADINFNITNNGYTKIEEIEIIVKLDRQSKFDIIENIGEIGELIKSQSKKVYFKLKPKVIGNLEIFFEITYKGCEDSITESKRIFIKEIIHREWQVIPNPYRSGIPIDNDDIFVGRESLIQEVLIAIKKDPVFIMGHRRMGKTSLVKYIQRNYLTTDEYLPIFFSAEKMVFSSMNDFLFSFSRPIANDLVRMKVITKDQKDDYLKAIRANGLIDFGVFFDDILYEISDLGKVLILIIDEYPKIHEQVDLKKIDEQFISNLRGYMQNNSNEFRMIYTGASSLKYLKSQYSSNIMGVGKSIEVSFLTEEDIKELISKPLNNQMQFEDSAFQYLMELSNGQPFLVQVILNYLVDKLNREKKGSMVFKEAIEEGVVYFLNQSLHLKYDWGNLGEDHDGDDTSDNRFFSSNLTWSKNEEKIAKAYKQLIITSLTDNWKKSKNGLTKKEIFERLENGLSDFQKIDISIFDETLNLMSSTSDILKMNNNLFFIKIGLFREWVINKMNFSFDKTLLEVKHIINQ